LEPIRCRAAETSRLIDILLRYEKNNAALVGPAGVGKTAIVEGLAERIAVGDVPLSLRGIRVLALDHVALLGGTMYRGQYEERVNALVEGVTAAAKEAGVPFFCNRVGSMFTWFFTASPVTDWTSAAKCDTRAFGRFFHAMLDRGVYLPPSQFESAFLSAAHTQADVEETISVAKQAFVAMDEKVRNA